MQNLFPLQPYQQDLIDKLKGYKPGELAVFMGGRQTGKSMYYQYATAMKEAEMPVFTASDKTLVDNVPWYVVKCKKNVAAWIRDQDRSLWYEHIDKNWYVYKDRFDVHEQLLTMMSIKFGDE